MEIRSGGDVQRTTGPFARTEGAGVEDVGDNLIHKFLRESAWLLHFCNFFGKGLEAVQSTTCTLL